MSEYGITEEDFEKFEENARTCAPTMFNEIERIYFSKEDVLKLLRESYK